MSEQTRNVRLGIALKHLRNELVTTFEEEGFSRRVDFIETAIEATEEALEQDLREVMEEEPNA